mmetsp:Transcript_2303/g.3209  ORF Transcript_2303/g.3209 Transcript_2303/m.3209 type:complete len:239 (+) Transcript_2303:177-893(+)|eukprot:CAMPEP_0117759274 /NCGR_PEP_ID=MMETSP0947-20121206/15916_1 /TAXON_ID=44440 /ORGANISM="Chattonella subsalsa, Strain CCMP2191" /LENGTH=238 /DNA_ID=CAMNT_0005579701 /DNA_START=53 /DNA_END=769 /DNA_ORIENTATION=-
MNSREPEDNEIADAVSSVVSNLTLSTDHVTYNSVERHLEALFVVPLQHRKDFIRQVVDETLRRHNNPTEESKEDGSQNDVNELPTIYDNNGKRVKSNLRHDSLPFINTFKREEYEDLTATIQNIVATSTDIRFPVENIINNSKTTIWSSTGMFPQTLIFKFSRPVHVFEIIIYHHNITNLKVGTLDRQKEFHFDCDDLETTTLETELPFATSMDVTINAASSEFCMIGNVVLYGVMVK